MRALARSGYGYNSIITEQRKMTEWEWDRDKGKKEKKIIATVCSVPMESDEGKKKRIWLVISFLVVFVDAFGLNNA